MCTRCCNSFFRSLLLSLILEVLKLVHKLDLTIQNLLWECKLCLI
ncbi:hypothetical protein CUMW_256880 [Citrus unshiu]|uniref:Uncharacterized protein n=1 Tax=Citrus unshiu TaxID=55188 RepID=A0A2H5QSA0_CITUN|nr:hypothetical protein CUMW_256880 [Citrus unshiu]